ncbi:MAG TPA: metallopeptidase family protein [Hyphomicrobiales bacterium]|nr:metallopeptidase family protein [Hyphomicrobiales bacterium]
MSERHRWNSQAAPSLADIEALAAAAYRRLPEPFRASTAGIVFRVEDFATDEVLDRLGIDDPFDLLGLFQGVGMAHDGAVPFTGRLPNMIFLYRRPILDYWAEHEDTLDAVVTHVLVHEIGHHFGFSDADMEAIERSAG